MFVELHAQSAFSFLEGADLPETLVTEAARLGMGALALVDRDGLYGDRKSTRLNSSHGYISYAVFCLKKKQTKVCHGASFVSPVTRLLVPPTHTSKHRSRTLNTQPPPHLLHYLTLTDEPRHWMHCRAS